MALSDVKVREYMKRLLLARMRILSTNGFYGILLMHMIFSIDEECETAYTDGDRIAFSPEFLENLNDHDLDVVLMHEILHVVLRHCVRGQKYNDDLFNYACDIVVNSNIKQSLNNKDDDIRLSKYGVGMHLTPNGAEGHLFTAEEVYQEVLKVAIASGKWKYDLKGNVVASVNNSNKGDNSDNSDDSDGSNGNENGGGLGKGNKGKNSGNKKDGDSFDSNPSTWDDHSKWTEIGEGEDDEDKDVWAKRFEDTVRTIELRESIMGRGLLPAFARRLIGQLRNPKTDWRQILNDFIQEDICDYSFAPPDKRYGDSDFFLPDFNEKEFTVKNVLFMVDTSGSVSDGELTQAMSEIKGAIDQFGGKLEGQIGFFDAGIIEPVPFTGEEDFLNVKAAGGGGTDFHVVFKYIKEHMQGNLPSSIIMITDGYAPFPKEEMALGVPVLWLINNYNMTPPWGKVARIVDEENK